MNQEQLQEQVQEKEQAQETEPTLEDPRSPREVMLAIVHQLGSNRPADVQAACRVLKSIGPEMITVLMDIVQEEGIKGRWRRGGFLTIAFLTAGLLLGDMVRIASFDSMEFLAVWMIGISALSVFIAQSISVQEGLDRLQTNATLALTLLNDLRIVAPLLSAFRLGDGYVRRIIGKALIRLLPRLREADARILDEAQRGEMFAALDDCARPLLSVLTADLGIAILKALEQIGDKKALPYVERLAAGRGKTELHREIQEAAIACLPFLQLRVNQQQLSKTLLRPVNEEEPDPGTLLRAMDHELMENPASLLRSLEGQKLKEDPNTLLRSPEK